MQHSLVLVFCEGDESLTNANIFWGVDFDWQLPVRLWNFIINLPSLGLQVEWGHRERECVCVCVCS